MHEGLRIFPGHLSRERQRTLLAEILSLAEDAPLYVPTLPRSGAAMTARMTNCGPLGWVTDAGGYRYQAHHPVQGTPWPPMPKALLDLWDALALYPAHPEACLVNFYGPDARMGLHRDQDEDATDAPVLSVSLGDDALFRMGGPSRRDPTRSFRLRSGDVLVLGGAARHCFHGVDRIYPGTSRLIPGGGRINLTLRRVTRPGPVDQAEVSSRAFPPSPRGAADALATPTRAGRSSRSPIT